MKGGWRFRGRVAVSGKDGGSPPDYYLQYLHALKRVFDKQVAK